MTKYILLIVLVYSLFFITACEQKNSTENKEISTQKSSSDSPSTAKELKPIQKPESMSQNQWGGRVLSAVDELRENPMYYEMLKDQNNQDPVIEEALRIYKENYLK